MLEMDETEVLAMFEDSKELASTMVELWAADFEDKLMPRVNIKTGNLRSSIFSDPVDSLTWMFGTDLFYAPYVHEGTPPHIIEGNPWLYWDGAEHPVRRVNHPGYEGNPFFDDTLEETETQLDNYLEDAIASLGLE